MSCAAVFSCGDQPIKVDPMRPVDPLLELRVDIHRHPRISVADLAHDPLHVELVGP